MTLVNFIVVEILYLEGAFMPRRKNGHMVGPCPPTKIEDCRACRLGYPCPKHDLLVKPDYMDLAKKKRRKKTGKKKKSRGK
jgi:hypothetical protein